MRLAGLDSSVALERSDEKRLWDNSCGRLTPGIARPQPSTPNRPRPRSTRLAGSGTTLMAKTPGAPPPLKGPPNGAAAGAARDIDTTDVAGKSTRPNFNEHPAAAAAAADPPLASALSA